MGESYTPPEALEFKIPQEKDNDSEQKKSEKLEQIQSAKDQEKIEADLTRSEELEKDSSKTQETNSEESEEKESEQSEQAENPEEKEKIRTTLTPSEKREKEKVFAEVTEGLANLYELLPKREKVTKREVKELINLTILKKLSLPMKNILAALTARHKLLRDSKDRFVAAGVGILGIWIHTQALVRAAPEAIHEI